MLPVDSVVLLT